MQGRIGQVTEQNNEQLVGTNRADALPKSWEPQAVEKDLYEGWVEKGYFTPDANSEAEPYSIVLPPPNVTGQLHMGHALDHTLIDSIIRRKRMQGYATLWLPGADHAGIATQTKVEAKLKETEGKKRWDYEREEFIDKVWEWKEQYGGTIQNQMRAIGDSVDWSRERFTLDDGLSRAVQTIFKNLYDEGMIYQANRLVNWSPVLETAVSDIEVPADRLLDQGDTVTFGDGATLVSFILRGHTRGGVGLGLSLVRQIAQHHGGTVHYEDRKDGGSCFILRLPAQG